MEHHLALDPSDDPRFWFIVDVAIGRERGIPLAGPPATEVFPELPRPLILDALRSALDWFAHHEGRGEATVSSALRAWAYADDGVWLSKPEAVRWAASRLPSPLIGDDDVRWLLADVARRLS